MSDQASSTETQTFDLNEAIELAINHHLSGNLAVAEQFCSQILAVVPDQPEILYLMGVMAFDAGQLDAAITYLERAISARADFAIACNALGAAFQNQGRYGDAEKQYRLALQIDPKYPDAHLNLGICFRLQAKLDEAATHYRKAIQLKPDYAKAYNNLGNVLKDLGLIDEAALSYRRAIESLPSYSDAHSNLLLTEQYRLGHTSESLFELHREWEQFHGSIYKESWPVHANVANSERKIRIGFVSPDFNRHPVGYFVVGLLRYLDKSQFQSFCYSNGDADQLTEQIRAATDSWQNVAGLTDQDLATQIMSDAVDILVDLSGHSAKNRLLMFARKPAPVLVSWAGYVGTTGLGAMDYLVSDQYSTPEAEEPFYQEKIIRMPEGWLSYTPPSYAPPVSPLPAGLHRHITFGSFCNPAKINDQVISVWSEILHRVDNSHLFIKFKYFDLERNQRWLRSAFESNGIDERRLILQGFSPHDQALACYSEVDVALDPFPYSGGLTTLESLWMGVPVVTLSGDTFASRHCESHLRTLGRAEWVALNREDYVAKAVGLTGDLHRLAEIRAGLRDAMKYSALCDLERFAAGFGQLMRTVWQNWCGGNVNLEAPASELDVNALIHAAAQHISSGALADADRVCQRIIVASPNNPVALCFMGICALRRQQIDAAIELFRKALASDPNYPEAHNNLGNAFLLQARYDDAVASFKQAITLFADFSNAHYNLGNALKQLGQLEDAVASYHRAIMIDPGYVKANNNFGNLLRELGRIDEAEACFRRALLSDPSFAEAHLNYAVLLLNRGEQQAALQSFDNAIALKPQNAGWKIRRALALPVIPSSATEITDDRARLKAAFVELQTQNLRVADPLIEIGSTSFHLAYHHLDDRPLQEIIANFYLGVCPSLLFEAPHCSGVKNEQHQRIRIGFLSSYFHSHTIGKLSCGFIEKLSRDRFEIIVFQPDGRIDEMSERINSAADKVVPLMRHIEVDQKSVAAEELDILFYPDIGMDPYTYFMAFARLAPVQAMTWGHPDTSGLPHMDYFVTSNFLEPPDTASHYTEKRICLPALPTFYYRPELPETHYRRTDYGLIHEKHLYLCPQSLFKLHPDFDNVLGEILRRDPDGLLVLIEDDQGGNWNKLLLARFEKTFHASTERVVFLPRMDRQKYMGLLKIADAVLDPPTFSGGNSSLEAFAMSVPIVTWPGNFMRSRVTAGCYRQMGLGALIVGDEDGYVSLALKLAHDRDFRKRMQTEIAENAHKLFESQTAIKSLEDFFIEAHNALTH